MTSDLADSLGATDPLGAAFADHAVLQAMLDVEIALAAAEARLGIIPAAAADAIRAVAVPHAFDGAALARSARSSGTPVIALVAALTARVRAVDDESARFVHWGATSQDISDTALALCVQRAMGSLGADVERAMASLRRLSDAHAGTVMLARTLLQPAPPATFGLKVAGWFSGVRSGWTQVTTSSHALATIQFGGASGTLAALGTRGLDVARDMAQQLGLQDAPPWHTQRHRIGAFVAACGLLTAATGKIARDLSLLMQWEVAEAFEIGGGSSTMPHKRNPAKCAIALAAATRVPGLVASTLTAMVQEHERAVGGWHAEWPLVSETLRLTGAAVAAIADAVDGIEVDANRMRANLDDLGGLVFAEKVMMQLAPVLGRDLAHGAVNRAVADARSSRRSFVEALASEPDVARHLDAGELSRLSDPRDYLGAAESIRRRLLDGD